MPRRFNVGTLEGAKKSFHELGRHLFTTSYFGIRCDFCGKTKYIEGRYLQKLLDNGSYKCGECISKARRERWTRTLKKRPTDTKNTANNQAQKIGAQSKEFDKNRYVNFFQTSNYSLIKNKIKESMKNSTRQGVTQSNVINKELVVSMTTTWNRINETPLAVETILNQQVMPNRIVLWIDKQHEEKELPASIKKQMERGLEVRYCTDVGPGTKLIPSLKEFPEAVIITVDSDIFYDNTLIKDLTKAYRTDNFAVHAMRCREISVSSGGKQNTYRNWKLVTRKDNVSCSHVATGVGGVLYPPHCLHENVFDIDSLKETAFKQDDLWFYTMEMLKGTRVLRTNSTSILGQYGYVENKTAAEQDGLCKSNVGKGGGNDKSIEKLAKKYLRKTINICYVCNSKFKPWLEMSMKSVRYNNPFMNVNFHIFTDDKKFQAPKMINVSVHKLDMNKIRRSDGIRRVQGDIKTSLCKFFIPEVLRNCDRVLYLDCDTACCGPLYEILDIDLDGKSIGVVEDYWVTRSKQYKDHRSNKISPHYFNSGMIIYDTKLCQGTSEKLLKWNRENRHLFMDQDALNAVFSDSKKIINPRFNMLCRYYVKDMCVIDSSDRITLPIILHFTGTKKPDAGGTVKKYVYDFYRSLCR